jgi:hypothetical protein
MSVESPFPITFVSPATTNATACRSSVNTLRDSLVTLSTMAVSTRVGVCATTGDANHMIAMPRGSSSRRIPSRCRFTFLPACSHAARSKPTRITTLDNQGPRRSACRQVLARRLVVVAKRWQLHPLSRSNLMRACCARRTCLRIASAAADESRDSIASTMARCSGNAVSRRAFPRRPAG